METIYLTKVLTTDYLNGKGLCNITVFGAYKTASSAQKAIKERANLQFSYWSSLRAEKDLVSGFICYYVQLFKHDSLNSDLLSSKVYYIEEMELLP